MQRHHLRKEWIITTGIVLVIITGIVLQQFFSKRLDFNAASSEQEQQLITDQFNNQLLKLNKQLSAFKDENRHLKNANQELEKKLEESRYVEHEIHSKIDKLSVQKSQLEKTYHFENNTLQQKITILNKENLELQALISELQQQIKNHKINSYGLFQAGKLEVELSNLDQQLVEQYDNVAQKKSGVSTLKDKCGKLRTNGKFCKEYDASVNSIIVLEKQLEHLHNKRDDLKQRINTYLSSSTQTNPH